MDKSEIRFGDLLRLRGKTSKGKSRIGTYGEWWKVMQPMTEGDLTDPVGIRVGTAHPMSERLIHVSDDPDFEIVGIEHAVS